MDKLTVEGWIAISNCTGDYWRNSASCDGDAALLEA
jgi:hypothetical protein